MRNVKKVYDALVGFSGKKALFFKNYFFCHICVRTLQNNTNIVDLT